MTVNSVLSEKYPKGEKKEYLYTLSKKTNNPCPYGICGGDGTVTNYFFDNELKEVIQKRDSCKCTFVPTQEDLKKQAKIPKIFEDVSVSSFDTSLYNDKETAVTVKNVAINFVERFEKFEETGDGLYLFSKTKGAGKTRLACSIGNALIKTRRCRVKFIRTIDLISLIKSTYRGNTEWSEFDILENLKKVRILIIDDIGAERPTEWVNEIFLNIIDYRATSKLVTIFTSNIQQASLQLDERIKSRISDMSEEIHFPEISARQILADDKHKKLKNILFS